MRVLIESKNDLDTQDRQHAFQDDLKDVTVAVEQHGSINRLETVALMLTIKQVNKDFEIPAQERFTGNGLNFISLAREDLKEKISSKWSAMIAAIKKIYKRFIEFVKQNVNRLRAMIRKVFRRRPTATTSENKEQKQQGAENKQQEKSPEQKGSGNKEQTVGEETSTNPDKEPEKVTGDVVNETKGLEIDSCYVDMGKEANLESLAERFQFYVRLLDFIHKIAPMHTSDRILDELIRSTDWKNKFHDSLQDVFESFMSDLGATVNNEIAIVNVSETYRIEMVLSDDELYPGNELESGKMVTLEAPSDPTDYVNLLNATMVKLDKGLDNLVEVANQSARDIEIFTSAQGGLLTERFQYIMPTLNRRLRFYASSLTLVERTCNFTMKLVEG